MGGFSWALTDSELCLCFAFGSLWKMTTLVFLFLVLILCLLFLGWFLRGKYSYTEPDEDEQEPQRKIILEALEDIDFEKGRIFFRGTAWPARSQIPIPKGDKVCLVKREGIVWWVEPWKGEEL